MSRRQRKAVYWQDAPMPRDQMVLFAERLEDVIPADHPVRMVDELLSRLDWKEWECKYHGSRGQPPIHPSVMCKILIFSLLRRLRSSRQISYALKHSIDFMWLSSGRHVDHRTLCGFRRQHAQGLKAIFRQIVQLSIDMGAANLSELCIDGSRVLANSNRFKTWTADRVEKLLNELDSQLSSALASLEEADNVDEDLFGSDCSADKLPPELADMQQRRAKLAEHLETLKEMDQARANWGADRKKQPAQLPKTDPDSRILPNKEGGYAANYTPMVTTDSFGGFIVACDVVIGNVEHDQLIVTVDTVTSEYSVEVERVLADKAYTTGANIDAAEERGVELVGPLAEPKCVTNAAERDDLTEPVAEDQLDALPVNPQTKRFDKSAFIYDEQADCYYCPAGKQLSYRYTRNADKKHKTRRFYSSDECPGCPLWGRCRSSDNAKGSREITHDIHEPARRRHRERMKTPEAQAAYTRRTHPAETPFAAIKSTFDLRRFLLRGKEGVGQEWLWASTAFNVKKLLGMHAAVRAHLDRTSESGVV